MSIEEAKEILNEAVITEPSIKSYNYISADKINMAIEKIIIEIDKKDQELKELKEGKSKTRYYAKKISYVKCIA